MGVSSETRYLFHCDRCSNGGNYSGWGEASDDGWQKVAIFDDDAEGVGDMTWNVLCPDDVGTLKAWLENSVRGLM